MGRLDILRADIDNVDDGIVALFRKRMEICKDVALFKRDEGIPVLNTGREKQVLNRVMESLPDELRLFAKQLFLTLFEISKAYQVNFIDDGSLARKDTDAKLPRDVRPFPSPARVAYPGFEGEISHLAADKLFPAAQAISVRDPEGVLEAIEKGLCGYGVLPAESNFAGCTNNAYDLVRKHHLCIVRAAQLPIKHCLLANSGVRPEDVRQIFAHPHALAQCSDFVKSLGKVAINSCESAATAAKLLSETGNADAACIAPEKCASVYSLSILVSDVQDSFLGRARFIAVSKGFEVFNGAHRTSTLVNLRHGPGSLNKLLDRLSAMNLNLTRLEYGPIASSAPDPSYYLDFEADISDGSVLDMLSGLEKCCDGFTFLGSYEEIE